MKQQLTRSSKQKIPSQNGQETPDQESLDKTDEEILERIQSPIHKIKKAKMAKNASGMEKKNINFLVLPFIRFNKSDENSVTDKDGSDKSINNIDFSFVENQDLTPVGNHIPPRQRKEVSNGKVKLNVQELSKDEYLKSVSAGDLSPEKVNESIRNKIAYMNNAKSRMEMQKGLREYKSAPIHSNLQFLNNY